MSQLIDPLWADTLKKAEEERVRFLYSLCYGPRKRKRPQYLFHFLVIISSIVLSLVWR